MRNQIVRHTAYNAAGILAPTVAAVLAIPFLYHALGADRFGLLTLVWAIVSYFGIFDLGLGRALTLQLSIVFAESQDGLANELTRTAHVALAVLGVLAGVTLILASAEVVRRIDANIDPTEMIGTLWAIAAALPFIVLTSGVRGALEAKSAFGVLNAIRVPMGVLNFVLPVLVAEIWGPRLDYIAWTLTVTRIGGLALHAFFMVRAFPGVLGSANVQGAWIKVLLRNGGWMTVSNIVSPIMGYLDRFIVGFILPAAAVAYYATPQEMILKAYVIPGALTTVLFPRFAGDRKNWRPLYFKSLVGASAIMLPVCVIGIVAAHPLLSLWVGQSFADQSFRVTQILFLGLAFGAMASIPYTLLQATGYANLTAVSHVLQVPIFIAASYYLTLSWGIEGAAIAWSCRLLIDAVILFAAAQIMPSRPLKE